MSSYMVQPKNLFDVDFVVDSHEEWVNEFAAQFVSSLSIYDLIQDYCCHHAVSFASNKKYKHIEVPNIDKMIESAICSTLSLRNEYERRLELYVEYREQYFGSDNYDDIEHPDSWLLAWTPDCFSDEKKEAEIKLFDEAFLLSLQESAELKEIAQEAAKWYAEKEFARLMAENNLCV